MKKLVFVLLMTLGSFGMLQAQSIQSGIMSYLKSEGYLPSYDGDGDIQFKKEGCFYYVIVKDIDEGYSYVEVRVPFSVTDMSLSELQQIASEITRANTSANARLTPTTTVETRSRSAWSSSSPRMPRPDTRWAMPCG